MLYIHNTSLDQKVLCCEVVRGALHRTPTCQKRKKWAPFLGLAHFGGLVDSGDNSNFYETRHR